MEPSKQDWIDAIIGRIVDECPYHDDETRDAIRAVLKAGLETVGPDSLVGTEVIEDDYFEEWSR